MCCAPWEAFLLTPFVMNVFFLGYCNLLSAETEILSLAILFWLLITTRCFYPHSCQSLKHFSPFCYLKCARIPRDQQFLIYSNQSIWHHTKSVIVQQLANNWAWSLCLMLWQWLCLCLFNKSLWQQDWAIMKQQKAISV